MVLECGLRDAGLECVALAVRGGKVDLAGDVLRGYLGAELGPGLSTFDPYGIMFFVIPYRLSFASATWFVDFSLHARRGGSASRLGLAAPEARTAQTGVKLRSTCSRVSALPRLRCGDTGPCK